MPEHPLSALAVSIQSCIQLDFEGRARVEHDTDTNVIFGRARRGEGCRECGGLGGTWVGSAVIYVQGGEADVKVKLNTMSDYGRSTVLDSNT